MKVCVLGLGQVGLPTALHISSRGFDVWGYDISENAVAMAKNGGINATTNWNKIPPVDVYVVCVKTSWKDDMPDLTPIFDVCKKIAEKAEPSSLVSIESTIIPGTCRKIHENILKACASLIHVPHRYWAGDQVRHGVKQMRVMGAMDNKSLEWGLRFYRDQLEIPLHIAPCIEVAEMSKIAENADRYVQIAFAEELSMTCEKLGLDFEDVKKSCNTKWNVEMLEARDGILGHCLPKDTRYLASIGPSCFLLKGAMSVDEAYRKWHAIRQESSYKHRSSLKSSRVCAIITALNEEKTIGDIVKRTKKVLGDGEIIVVDDGSTDSTVKIAKESGATTVISHWRNLGVGTALRTGIRAALSSNPNPDIIVKLDGDGQHLPEDIPKLVQPILDGEADLVLGTRFTEKIQMPFIKKIGNKIITWLIKKLTGYPLTDTQSGFRAMRGTVAKIILPVNGTYTYTQEMIIHAAKNKLKVREVPITCKERRHGKSRVVKNPITYGFRIVFILIRTFRDYNPLLTFGLFGVLLAGLGLLVYLHLFWDLLMFGIPIAASPTSFLIAITLLISGFQALMFALLADMIGGMKKKSEDYAKSA